MILPNQLSQKKLKLYWGVLVHIFHPKWCETRISSKLFGGFWFWAWRISVRMQTCITERWKVLKVWPSFSCLEPTCHLRSRFFVKYKNAKYFQSLIWNTLIIMPWPHLAIVGSNHFSSHSYGFWQIHKIETTLGYAIVNLNPPDDHAMANWMLGCYC